MTEQDYSSRRHLQKWLIGVSPVIHEAFSMRRWLRYSGAIATLKDLQAEIQCLYDIIGRVNLLLYWSAPWWQSLGPESRFPITPESAHPALWRPSHQALLQSTPAMPPPQDNRARYAVSGTVDRPQGSEEVNSADLINPPELAPAAARVSPDIKAGKNSARLPASSHPYDLKHLINSLKLASTAARMSQDIKGKSNGAWPSPSPHPRDFIEEKRSLPGYESPVLHDIAMARRLAGEAGAILRATLPAVFSFQRSGRAAVLGVVNPPDRHPAGPALNIIGEYLRHGIGPPLESPSITNGLLSWEGGEAWPEFASAVAEFKPRQTTLLPPQEDEPEATGMLPEHQTGAGVQDAPVLMGKHISGKPAFPGRRVSPRQQPFKAWSPQIAWTMQTKEEIRRQFNAVRSQVTPAVSFMPSVATHLITEKRTAIEEIQLKGAAWERAAPVLEAMEVPLTPVPPQSPKTHTLPIERNQMARLTGEIRRQFSAVQLQTRFSADLRLPTMISTLSVSNPLSSYSYLGQENIYPEQLLSPRDLSIGLSEVITQLTEEVKAANRRVDGQGKHEVHNIFNVTVEAGALEAEDSSALSQKLGKLLAHEARRYGINL